MNTLIKVLLHTKQPDKVLSIWNDIEKVQHISYPLLLKCCTQIQAHSFDIEKCIQILQWLNESDWQSNDCSRSMTKLISKCATAEQLKTIHALIPPKHCDIYIQSALIHNYGKYPHHTEHALKIFGAIPDANKDAIMVATMMNALIRNGLNQEAIELYFSHESNDKAHMFAIKACTNMNAYDKGRHIHQAILHQTHSMQLKTTLIEFYGRCGDMHNALRVFDTIASHKKDAISVWTMMKMYMKNEEFRNALSLYKTYYRYTNDMTHVLAIKACAHLRDYEACAHLRDSSAHVQNALLHFYSTQNVDEAQKLFKSMHHPDAISLNTMMTALRKKDLHNDALLLYDEYASLHDNTSHMLAIKACINTHNAEKGRSIITERIHTHNDAELYSTLVEFYGHFGEINNAWNVFDDAKASNNIVLVNAMMKALNKNAHSEQALAIYEQYECIHDDVSHLTAIKACVMSRNYTKGQAIHSTVGSDCDIFIQTAFIDFYGTFHQIQKAQNIFTSIENINTVCVNAMLKAYSNNDMFDKLLQLYDATQGQCLHDDISHLLALKGCIRLNAFEEGQRIHLTYIHGNSASVEVLNILIEFYAHFGDISAAIDVFNSIEDAKKDMISVNTMMNAYLDYDEAENVLKLYDEIAVIPDSISYLLALKACIRTCEFERGKEIHSQAMNVEDLELRNTLIDFYGHFFDIDSALRVYESIADEDKTIVSIGAMME
eukprot:951328_1